MSGELWAELGGRQGRVEAALAEALAAGTEAAPPALAEAMGYSLLAPGKRLRPLLAVLACEAAGGGVDAALPGAVAVEMVHTYSLVHDDLPAMDDDDLRRGRPTCHVRYGEALAILAGDALLTLAFGVVAGGCPARTAAVSCAELARGAGAAGMVGGQVLDLEAEEKLDPSPRPPPPQGEGESEKRPLPPAPSPTGRGGERPGPGASSPSLPRGGGRGEGSVTGLEAIHRRKTGALFRSAVRLGVYAAQAERPGGADPATLAAADEYADALGLLFQVTDDLLDAEGSADKAGKRVGKDAGRGKLTYPGLLGVEESRRRAADLGRQAVGAAGKLGSGPLARLAGFVVARDR